MNHSTNQKQDSNKSFLRMIQNRFTRCKWFVEGDIKGFFDNIDHNVMIGILRKRINLTKNGHYAIINLCIQVKSIRFLSLSKRIPLGKNVLAEESNMWYNNKIIKDSGEGEDSCVAHEQCAIGNCYDCGE